MIPLNIFITFFFCETWNFEPCPYTQTTTYFSKNSRVTRIQVQVTILTSLQMSDSAPSLFILPDQASVCFANSSKIMEQTDRIIIGSTILTFSLISILLNVTVTVALLHNWSSFRTQPFTQFVLSMILAGTIYTSVNFFVSIPCSFNYCQYLKWVWKQNVAETSLMKTINFWKSGHCLRQKWVRNVDWDHFDVVKPFFEDV